MLNTCNKKSAIDVTYKLSFDLMAHSNAFP